METITIINKSGKVMSTTKHLVNLFKDAKLSYQEKKAEFREERRIRNEERMSQRLLTERMRTSDIRSQSSHRSHRSRSHAPLPKRTESRQSDQGHRSRRRPPLTIENLSQFEGSVASDHGKPSAYQKPYMEDALTSEPSLVRRNTDQPLDRPSMTRQSTMPAMHTSPAKPTQTPVDMNLAYGEMHASHIPPSPGRKEHELTQKMSRLDSLLEEAQCIGHSATNIIKSLQQNPETMAAVALTLAEISNLVKIMSPGILSAIKGSSPAIFSLLICPEFLIGTGLAVGVTIVMFGGYKIIKKIQANATAAPSLVPVAHATGVAMHRAVDADGNEMDEAMTLKDDLSSVTTWIRGVEESSARDEWTSTSVDAEIITPEAHSIRRIRTNERIRERAREEHAARVPARASSARKDRRLEEEERGETRRSRSRHPSHPHHKSRTVLADTVATAPASEKSSGGGGGRKKSTKGKEREKETGKDATASVLKVFFRGGKSDKVKIGV